MPKARSPASRAARPTDERRARTGPAIAQRSTVRDAGSRPRGALLMSRHVQGLPPGERRQDPRFRPHRCPARHCAAIARPVSSISHDPKRRPVQHRQSRSAASSLAGHPAFRGIPGEQWPGVGGQAVRKFAPVLSAQHFEGAARDRPAARKQASASLRARSPPARQPAQARRRTRLHPVDQHARKDEAEPKCHQGSVERPAPVAIGSSIRENSSIPIAHESAGPPFFNHRVRAPSASLANVASQVQLPLGAEWSGQQ